ncbi:unnamed protein product [Cuscuta epithymum]|uniref:Uncharacterized protein n=1 Tax=Cuscuta epithymum TaxID=186058 RepID=A0AAV0G597_9ASTE|nr:unnamed protein product [Cuscuta epithymum]
MVSRVYLRGLRCGFCSFLSLNFGSKGRFMRMVASSSVAPHSQKDLEEELIDYGVRLFPLPSSNDELLSILDKVETLLVRVAQAPSETTKMALHPIMKALIGSELLAHSVEDVKVSIVLCLSEIMRITAPQQPYDDDVMKEIFKHIVESFQKLSHVKSQCYSKAVQILSNVSKVRACVMLLDLDCNTLVTDMFKLFLRIVGSYHSSDVLKNMEDIMTWIINECDEVSGELLMPLLHSIKNENQKASTFSWKLGQTVLKKCSAIVRHYVVEAVKSMSLDVGDYAGILASICHEVTDGENLIENENTPHGACSVRVVSNVVLPLESQQEATPTLITTGKRRHESENQPKTLPSCDQTDHNKDNDSPIDPQRHNLEEMQPGTKLSTRPRRKGGKSLRQHGNNSAHCKINVPEESNLLLEEDCKQTTPVILSPENKDSSLPVSSTHIRNGNGTLQKKERPKKNQVDLSSEKGSEETTIKAEPKRSSRKKEPTARYNGEKSLGTKIVTEKGGNTSPGMSLLHKNDHLSKKAGKTNSLGKETLSNKEDSVTIAVTKAAHGEALVGVRIKVWWPLDRRFYDGKVASFDHLKKKHKVLYDDGEEEILNLGKQRWEVIKETPLDKDCDADSPVTPIVSAMEGSKKVKGDSSRKQKRLTSISETKRSRRKVQPFLAENVEQSNTTMQDVKQRNKQNNPPVEE